MKYAKILGLVAMALAALMAFAGTASATILTSPAGTTYTGTIHAVSEGATELKGEFGTVTCPESTVSGKVEFHGSTTTAGGKIETLTFGPTEKCTGGKPTSPVAVPGELEVHTEYVTNANKEWVQSSTANGNGTLTAKGGVVVVHNTLVGTCEFETGTGTDLGVLKGGTPAKLVIEGVAVRVKGSNILCGSTSTWKGTYKVDSPSTLLVD